MSKTNAAEKSAVQIVNLHGSEFALMPKAFYDTLVSGQDEDAMLVRAGEAARGEETFPDDVARRIVAGETPLKVIREWRGLTQEQLADRSGVPAKYISQLERRADGRNVGRKVAAKLGHALGVSADAVME